MKINTSIHYTFFAVTCEAHNDFTTIRWRDEISKAGGDGEMIEELLAAITSAGRADLVTELREQYIGKLW